jgi:hypothetical protein
LQELRVVERLLKEIDRLRPKGLTRGRHIAMRCHDHHRQRSISRPQLGLKFDATGARQPKIGQDAASPPLAPGIKKRLGIGVEGHAIAREPQH